MIVLTCSGTGGHVYPAIAVANYLVKEELLFVVDQGRLAEKIVADSDFAYKTLAGVGTGWMAICRAFWEMRSFFRTHNVKKVYSFGGFATVPVVIAAWLQGVSVILFEQNAIPGLANRVLAFFAQRVCVSIAGTEAYFKQKAVLVGNPVRKEYKEDTCLVEILALDWVEGRHCLVFGGSQGAEHLNHFIASEYAWFLTKGICVIHVVGQRYFDEHFTEEAYYVGYIEGRVAYVVLPYIQDMQQAYMWADYVVSRAGATTIAELIYFRKQALLVPYPYAKDDHQMANAQVLSQQDLALCVPQEELIQACLEELFDRPVLNPITQQEQAALDSKWQSVV